MLSEEMFRIKLVDRPYISRPRLRGRDEGPKEKSALIYGYE